MEAMSLSNLLTRKGWVWHLKPKLESFMVKRDIFSHEGPLFSQFDENEVDLFRVFYRQISAHTRVQLLCLYLMINYIYI